MTQSLLLTEVFILLRLFSDTHSITLHLRTFKVTGLFTLRSVLFDFNSRLVQFIGQRFQPVLRLLRERLCYELLGFSIVDPQLCEILPDSLDSAIYVIERRF